MDHEDTKIKILVFSNRSNQLIMNTNIPLNIFYCHCNMKTSDIQCLVKNPILKYL